MHSNLISQQTRVGSWDVGGGRRRVGEQWRNYGVRGVGIRPAHIAALECSVSAGVD